MMEFITVRELGSVVFSEILFCLQDENRVYGMLDLNTILWVVSLWFCVLCPSDDSDDSDGSLGEGLSFEPANHHAACKDEPCDQEDSLDDAKPLNGVLLQGKGELSCDDDYHGWHFTANHSTLYELISFF